MPALDRSLIASLPAFQGLTPDQQDEVLGEAQSVRYPKGVDVFQQDQEAQSFFLLLHGHLRVYRLTPDGQQVVVRYISPGEIFGVAMALGRTSYPATAAAVVDSVALVWPNASVDWALTLCAPSVSAVVGVKRQLPLASAVAVPISWPWS